MDSGGKWIRFEHFSIEQYGVTRLTGGCDVTSWLAERNPATPGSVGQLIGSYWSLLLHFGTDVDFTKAEHHHYKIIKVLLAHKTLHFLPHFNPLVNWLFQDDQFHQARIQVEAKPPNEVEPAGADPSMGGR